MRRFQRRRRRVRIAEEKGILIFVSKACVSFGLDHAFGDGIEILLFRQERIIFHDLAVEQELGSVFVQSGVMKTAILVKGNGFFFFLKIQDVFERVSSSTIFIFFGELALLGGLFFWCIHANQRDRGFVLMMMRSLRLGFFKRVSGHGLNREGVLFDSAGMIDGSNGSHIQGILKYIRCGLVVVPKRRCHGRQ